MKDSNTGCHWVNQEIQMEELLTPEYDGYRNFIRRELERGTEPNRLRYLALEDDDPCNAEQANNMLRFARDAFANIDGTRSPRIAFTEVWIPLQPALTAANTLEIARS